MKEIKTERTVYDIMYEAVDGTTFRSQEECAKYEESALGVLRAKLKKLIVNDQYDGWELMGGNEDNKILAVKMETEEDKDTVLQNYYLDQPWILKDGNNNTHKERLEKCVEQAYKEQDVILFGVNCDDCLYLIDTRYNIIDRLNKLDQKEETK